MKGSTVTAGASNDNELIRFSGLTFRSEHIECETCGWSGLAGSLKSKPSGSGYVLYACPSCSEKLAEHQGLSDGEIQQEMQVIRTLLALEQNAEMGASKEGGVAVKPRKVVPLSPRRLKPSYACIKIVPDRSEQGDNILDFAKVRARLKGIV
jgi:hypothetical protein